MHAALLAGISFLSRVVQAPRYSMLIIATEAPAETRNMTRSMTRSKAEVTGWTC